MLPKQVSWTATRNTRYQSRFPLQNDWFIESVNVHPSRYSVQLDWSIEDLDLVDSAADNNLAQLDWSMEHMRLMDPVADTNHRVINYCISHMGIIIPKRVVTRKYFFIYLLQFKCPNCIKDYGSEQGLKAHHRASHGVWKTKYRCTICKELCSSFFNLKVHLVRIHDDKTPVNREEVSIRLPNIAE